eukprot:TRINITY_DN68394_c0_g1_i1.p1 TRINITY_DN68394_c0_g1~~TRINITY_DN68394_c0_g1_i1.p1  ORF type:complete len:463 (-),score=66.45 TRINITY_DN68394_c0_g1_i1:55-1266(-)
MRATVEYRGGCSGSAFCVSPFAMLPSNVSYEASTCQCGYLDGLADIYASCGCHIAPAPCPAPPPPLQPHLKADVFVSGDRDQDGHGYVCFRAPALVTTKSGRLMAFAEGRRHEDCDDASGSSLVLRSSIDGGSSWGSLRKVYGEVGHSMQGTTPVVDLDSGDLHLLFTRDGQEIHAVTSRDDGKTWTLPTDHSAALVGEVTSAGTGPGAGTQLPSGRLVAAARAGADVFAAYSDDSGSTWRRGQSVGLGDTVALREGQVAQLAEGKLAMVLSATPEKGSGQMAVAVSSDDGETWAIPARMAPSTAGCQTPVASLGGTSGGLLVAESSGPCTGQSQMLLVTLDSKGGTEPSGNEKYSVPYGYMGFSSVIYIPRRPAVLYETGSDGPHEKIAFAASFGWSSELHV